MPNLHDSALFNSDTHLPVAAIATVAELTDNLHHRTALTSTIRSLHAPKGADLPPTARLALLAPVAAVPRLPATAPRDPRRRR